MVTTLVIIAAVYHHVYLGRRTASLFRGTTPRVYVGENAGYAESRLDLVDMLKAYALECQPAPGVHLGLVERS